MEEVQLQLWEQAKPDEIREAKQLLSRYRRMQSLCNALQAMPNRTDRQKGYLDQCQKDLSDIERAVNLILDDEIKRIVQTRYLDGVRHKVTVLRYRGLMHPSTVDRKIAKGIEAVANTLKIIR